MLTQAQCSAVRWYIGDVAGDDPFWGDPRAYLVVNSLFYPGIWTERSRAAEGKHLNPAILADPERLAEVLRELLSAFRPLGREQVTYRVERYADFLPMEQAGRTISFTSTSTAGFLEAYRDRRGIALMQFSLRPGTPCIPMAEALPDYAKPEEAEILLPPGLALSMTACPLRAKQLRILDADGQPPQIFVSVSPGAPRSPEVCESAGDTPSGMRVLEALNAGEEPEPGDVQAYADWKRRFLQ